MTLFHRILILLPALKICYLVSNHFYYKICPWENFYTQIYLHLSRIIFNLLYQAMLIGCIILCMQGFKVA